MKNEDIIRGRYRDFTKKLIEKNLQISAMESATGGQFASLITDTEGSSQIIKGSFVTYSNEAKIKQGVPAEVIEKSGVYSKETAEFMAERARTAYDADIGVGITGTMGNIDPNNNDSVPGEVYFAISMEDKKESFFMELPPMETRLEYKLTVCGKVLDELEKILDM